MWTGGATAKAAAIGIAFLILYTMYLLAPLSLMVVVLLGYAMYRLLRPARRASGNDHRP